MPTMLMIHPPELGKSDFQKAIDNCKSTPKAGMCPTILKQAQAAGLYSPPTKASVKQPTLLLGVVCTKSGSLRLRSKPVNGAIVRKVAKGTTGRFRATNVTGWVEFRPDDGGKYGFAAAKYICPQDLALVTDIVDLPSQYINLSHGYTTGASVKQPGGPVTGAGSFGATICTKKGPLNVRTKPSLTGSAIIARLAKGTSVVATPTTGASWVKVRTAAGKVGYASAKYVCRATSAGSLPADLGTKSGLKTGAGASVADKALALSKYTPLLLGAAGLLGVLLVLRRKK